GEPQVGERRRQQLGEEGLELVALDQARLQRDVDDVAPARALGDLVDLVRAEAGGVQGADDRAHRRARHDVAAGADALEHAQDADVREGAGPASGEDEAHASWLSGALHLTAKVARRAPGGRAGLTAAGRRAARP